MTKMLAQSYIQGPNKKEVSEFLSKITKISNVKLKITEEKETFIDYTVYFTIKGKYMNIVKFRELLAQVNGL